MSTNGRWAALGAVSPGMLSLVVGWLRGRVWSYAVGVGVDGNAGCIFQVRRRVMEVTGVMAAEGLVSGVPIGGLPLGLSFIV